MQNYFYDLHDQLVKVEVFRKDGTKETWLYTYDALGRRISKGRLKEDGGVETLSDGLEEEREFIWDGSHLLQEVYANGRYTYIYTDVDSYEPLAQIHNYTNEEGETYQETNYFHCDQIGIPREMTDREGKLLWFGDYFGWGKLKSETNITGAHQPFRLQNQYFDKETGLHYNFFRYYEPDAGRFVNQDPIGLDGGDNFYQFRFDSINWTDELGLRGGYHRPNLARRGVYTHNNTPIPARPNTRILNTIDRRPSDLSRFSKAKSSTARTSGAKPITVTRNEEMHQLFDNLGNVLEDFTKKKTSVIGVCDKRGDIVEAPKSNIYDCEQYSKTRCPLPIPGQVCYNKELFYSETNSFYTNPETTIICRKVK